MKKSEITTPKGKLNWVFISGEGRLNELNGKKEFSAEVQMPMADAKPLIATIDKFLAENKDKSMKGQPKSTGYRIDEASETVRFIFKTSATFPDGRTKVIKVYDAKANKVELPADVRIGNGSIGRLSGVVSVYSAPGAWGSSLWLDAIQVVKLEKYGSESSFKADTEVGEEAFVGFTAPFESESTL